MAVAHQLKSIDFSFGNLDGAGGTLAERTVYGRVET